MPATPLVDLQVPIQDLIDEGAWDQARQLQDRLQPLLSYISQYGVSMVKELLYRRGIIVSPTTCDPQAILLDAADHAELDVLMASFPVFAGAR